MDSAPSVPLGSHLTSSLPLSHTLDRECNGYASPRCTSASLPLRLVHAPLTRARAAWAALSITGHRLILLLTEPGERYSIQKKGLRRRSVFTVQSQTPGPELIRLFGCKDRKKHLFLSWFFYMFWSAPWFVLIDDYWSSKYLITTLFNHTNSHYIPWRKKKRLFPLACLTGQTVTVFSRGEIKCVCICYVRVS